MNLNLRLSIDWLLALVPITAIVQFLPATKNNNVLLFICAGVAIIPLAGLLGRATETLASSLGEGVGALLNATFGNAAELIIALVALRRGLIDVVKASITGSIIGNLLLVLGAAMLAGGVKYRVQTFNKTAVRSLTSSLALAAVGLLTPTIFHVTANEHPRGWNIETERRLSLAIAFVLFATYVCSLIFGLRTHSHLFQGGAVEAPNSKRSIRGSVMMLLGATAVIAWLSEALVGSVEAAREAMGLTQIFVGVVIVAVVGNAAEHSTAVLMALKNKMDLAIGIAVGSSQQVALFVAPILIFASYAFGAPITIEFTIPEVVAVLTAVYLVGQIAGDGESNWLEGVQLMAVYLIIGILFYFLPEGASRDINERLQFGR